MVSALCILAACRPQAAPSTPAATASAVATPTPAVTPVPTVDAAVADIQDEFLSHVNDLTSDVETLATATCADLIKETRANPAEVQQMRGFAATLQRAGTSQTALDSDDVRSALGDLGKAVSQLDAALSTCGIQP